MKAVHQFCNNGAEPIDIPGYIRYLDMIFVFMHVAMPGVCAHPWQVHHFDH